MGALSASMENQLFATPCTVICVTATVPCSSSVSSSSITSKHWPSSTSNTPGEGTPVYAKNGTPQKCHSSEGGLSGSSRNLYGRQLIFSKTGMNNEWIII